MQSPPIGPNEACDDGNKVDNDTCTNACKLAKCGDGMVQVGEEHTAGLRCEHTHLLAPNR